MKPEPKPSVFCDRGCGNPARICVQCAAKLHDEGYNIGRRMPPPPGWIREQIYGWLDNTLPSGKLSHDDVHDLANIIYKRWRKAP